MFGTSVAVASSDLVRKEIRRRQVRDVATHSAKGAVYRPIGWCIEHQSGESGFMDTRPSLVGAVATARALGTIALLVGLVASLTTLMGGTAGLRRHLIWIGSLSVVVSIVERLVP